MKWLRKLRDRLMGYLAPPRDERSIKAERLHELTEETARTLDRVDRIVPPTRTARIRREAMLAEQRFRR